MLSFKYFLHFPSDSTSTLLYRFHLVSIFINIIAVLIDGYMHRYANILIETITIIMLIFSFWQLQYFKNIKLSAYVFILTISSSLLVLITINHFATMSVVFILLLPLTTLIFLSIKESLSLTVLLVTTLGGLLYYEHLNNPTNPLAHNGEALFNLAYAAMIIYVFGLLYHFAILKTFQELDESNQQKALLLKEVHHRVKNNLNMISSIIGLHSNTLKGKEQEEMLKTQNRIESISLVHEMLYKHEDFSRIDFERYMHQLSDLLLNTYASDKEIDIHIKSSTQYMPLETMVQLGIMVNEFITNSLKYAFPNDKGTINLELTQSDKKYCFSYTDDGIGHPSPQTLLKHKSLGIKLINLTAKQLKGNVLISSPKGLHFEIEF